MTALDQIPAEIILKILGYFRLEQDLSTGIPRDLYFAQGYNTAHDRKRGSIRRQKVAALHALALTSRQLNAVTTPFLYE